MDVLDTVIAGIVTYNPDLERLIENIDAVRRQVRHILIVDNGSENYGDILNRLPSGIIYIKNNENQGIAKALCQIMEYAKKQNFKWVLTLDQDSIIKEGLVKEYLKYANDSSLSDVAMFTCLIKDRNFKDLKNESQNENVIDVPYCITSASFTNVDKYFCTQGYDTNFFIDAVDFDICFSLREKGYRITRINYIGLYHEVGHGENRHFLWKNIIIYNQKPFRIFYLARNTMLMYKKHKKLFPWYVMMKKEIVLLTKIIFYEDDKLIKIKKFLDGVKEARKKK